MNDLLVKGKPVDLGGFELDRIYNMDCLEAMKLMPDGCVDLVLTDPPFGDSTHDKHLGGVTLRDGSPAGQDLGFAGISKDECVALAQELTRVSARWVVFTCEWHYMDALHEAGLLVRFGIWRKRNGAPQFTGDRPGMGWEAIAICHRQGKKRWNGGGKHAFYDYPKPHNNEHPTQKPIALYSEILCDFSDPNAIILDPFMGSGTTAVACIRTNRHFIGFEIDEGYCAIANKRIAYELQQTRLAL